MRPFCGKFAGAAEFGCSAGNGTTRDTPLSVVVCHGSEHRSAMDIFRKIYLGKADT
jgi:hypothetical protein